MVGDRTLEGLTRDELVSLARARGVELPPGRPLKKAGLIELLRAAKRFTR
jgi:hypothetical protein